MKNGSKTQKCGSTTKYGIMCLNCTREEGHKGKHEHVNDIGQIIERWVSQ